MLLIPKVKEACPPISLRTSEALLPSIDVPDTLRKSSSATPEVNTGRLPFDIPVDTDDTIGWNKAIVPGGLGDQVEEAAKANNQDPAEIASWVELLQTNPGYMNFENLDGISESPFAYTIDERTKEKIQIERQKILAKYRKGETVDLSPLIFSSLQYNR